MDYLKVKVSFPASMLETRWSVKLGRLSGYDLEISSLWISLAAKLAISVRLDSVSDISTDASVAMRSNELSMPFIFLYIS